MDGLLGGKKEEKKEAAEGSFDLSKVYVWIKGLESKLNNLRREFDVLKEDHAKKNEKLGKEIRSINEDVLELKREKEKLVQKTDLMIKELRLTAGKEELMVLKKYVDLWNPMHFTTERDVERLIEDKLRENLISKEEIKTKKKKTGGK